MKPANITGKMIDHLKKMMESGEFEMMVTHLESINAVLIDTADDNNDLESMRLHIGLLQANTYFRDEIKEFIFEEKGKGGSI